MKKCKVKKEYFGIVSYFNSTVHASVQVGTTHFYKPHSDLPPIIKYTIVEIYQ